MLSPINNTNTPKINFTANHLVQHRHAQFHRFFDENPLFRQLTSAIELNKLPIFDRICFFDVLKFKRQMIGDLFSDGFRVFFSTIGGKKPAGILAAKSSMRYLNKGVYPTKIDLIHLKPRVDGPFDKTYNTYILNKEEVLKIIEQNREVYVNRLNLQTENSTEHIYKRLKETLRNGTNSTGERIDDIVGLTLGFPQQNSMIFHLEKCAGLDSEARANIPEYKAKLLEFFNDEKFPYKNLSEQELKKLKTSIESITKISSYQNALYDFVKYVDEPQEMKRISESARDYVKGFSIDMIC